MVKEVETRSIFPLNLVRVKREQQKATENPAFSLHEMVLEDGKSGLYPPEVYTLDRSYARVAFKRIEISVDEAKKIILEVTLGRGKHREKPNIKICESMENGMARRMKFEKGNFLKPFSAMEFETSKGIEIVGKTMTVEQQGNFMKEVLQLLQNQRAPSSAT